MKGDVARKARNEKGPGLYHVYARGNNREAIFLDDEDRRDYLLRLKLVVEEMEWRLLAYCLMGNHVHLLIETRRGNLGDGMRNLHGGFAQQFNRSHRRSGHVFGDRYGSVVITSDEHFKVAVRYIARNPLEAGLAKQLGEWPWASWPPAPQPQPRLVDLPRLLGWFGPAPDVALAALTEFITEPLPP
jgi:REP element-mobilizing transposase RayT